MLRIKKRISGEKVQEVETLQLSLIATRFFYADERASDGKSKGQALDGDAHAEFFAQLATKPRDVPWHATFVKDKGYVKF